MGVIQIRKAFRGNARLVVGLSSVSGDGKTLTAILLGYGLANYRPEKLGFLDTENRRGSLYADVLKDPKLTSRPTEEPFLIADLFAPFSPQRYKEAVMDFQAAGVEVLIVDSVTHEWEGTGGCQEIAEAGNPKVPNWNLAKKLHKSFVGTLLQSDMHIIVCVRAREKSKPERVDGKLEFVDLGLQPIQEKNFMFEMTASLMLHEQGSRQAIMKCPAALINVLGRQKGYITDADGHMLRQWVDGAVQLDPTVEKYRNRLISNTEGGVKHIEECWEKTPQAVRDTLGKEFHATLVKSAQGYEEQERLAKENNPQGAGTDQGAPPAGRDPAEVAEAEAIAARARANGEKAPVTNAQQQTPAAQAAASAAATATPAQSAATPAQPATTPAQQTTPAAQPAKKDASPPTQQQLVAPVTGVLPGDPVF